MSDSSLPYKLIPFQNHRRGDYLDIVDHLLDHTEFGVDGPNDSYIVEFEWIESINDTHSVIHSTADDAILCVRLRKIDFPDPSKDQLEKIAFDAFNKKVAELRGI